MKLLHTPDPADGNGTPPAPSTINPQPSTSPPPPAGTVVANAPTERERELAAELERARNETVEERKARTDRERTICEMQDEHHRYRKTVEAKPANPEPRKSGWTFFDY